MPQTTLAALAFALLLAVSAFAQAPPTDPSAREVAAALQKRYDTIRDFTAEFVHTYRGGVLRQQARERGTMQIKKPGRMRWDYREPERKLFVSDGRKLYTYVPADKQVIVSAMPAGAQVGTPVLFLAGRGDLLRDFEVSFSPEHAASGHHALKLVPKQPEPEYEAIVLVVDRESLQIRRLITLDHQGGTSAFEFSDIKENTGLADKLFAFTIPRGVDVIE